MEEDMLGKIGDYCRGEISDDDFRSLNRWIEASAGHRKTFEDYIKIYKESRQLSVVDRSDCNQALERVLGKYRIHRRRWIHRWVAAASFLLLVSVVTYTLWSSQSEPEELRYGAGQAVLILENGEQIALSKERQFVVNQGDGTCIAKQDTNVLVYANNKLQTLPEFHTVSVPRAGEFRLILADGTKIWVNSGTRLRYPTRFTGDKREIFVEGEIFLEVAKDTVRPFVVNACGIGIEVLGTSFNVSAYPEEEVVTTLVTGKVTVCNGTRLVRLVPGEQAISRTSDQRTIVRQVDPGQYISWVHGTWEFENITLREMVRSLSRWYDVDFVFRDTMCADLRFTGGVRKDIPLSEFLQMIERSVDIKFDCSDRVIGINYSGKNR